MQLKNLNLLIAMDIVSRLKFFLTQNGIANSTFADTCGIPRPTLSQLLNGRNKKVSDELIAKIHAAYPSLNIMWLMFGDGDVFVPNANSLNSSESSQLAENSNFSEPLASPRENGHSSQTAISFNDDDNSYQRQAQPIQPTAALSAVLQNMARSGVKAAPIKGSKSADAPRKVSSIMVFYSDNSFEVFNPG